MTPIITHLRSLGFIIENPTQLNSALSRGHQGAINAHVQNKGKLSHAQQSVYDDALRLSRTMLQYRHPIPQNERTIQDVIREDGEPFPFDHAEPATPDNTRYRWPVNIEEVRYCRHPETYRMFGTKLRDQFIRDFTIATFRLEEGLIGNRAPLSHKQIKALEDCFTVSRNREPLRLYVNYLRRYGLPLPLEYSQDSPRPDVNPFATDSGTKTVAPVSV